MAQKMTRRNRAGVFVTLRENADSLKEGLRLADEQSFDAVLLDLGLPDSQGLQTFMKFSSQEPSLPVIILSGLDDESIAARAVQLGAQDYLVKGNYLTQGDAGSKLLVRSIHYAIERHSIQSTLLGERGLLEQRVTERTLELSEANQLLQNLTARLVSAQEDERRRISLELHDEAGQALTALKLSLSMMRSSLDGDISSLDSQLQEAIDLVGNIMERLRTLAHDLRPPSLDNVELDQSLRDLCHRTAVQSKIHVDYRSSGVDSLPGYYQISIYRVVQESLTNIVKHAHAAHAWVKIECDAEGVHLSVRDDGVGFDSDAASQGQVSGIGVAGMRERVEALGGVFDITSNSGEGTSLLARMPLQE